MVGSGFDHGAQLGGIGGGSDDHIGHHAQVGQIEHTMVGRAVGPGYAGPVEKKRHRQIVQGDIGHDLVERPLQERGVDGNKRLLSCHRHSGRQSHRMLFGYARVDHTLGESPVHLLQTGSGDHGGRYPDDVLVTASRIGQGSPGDLCQLQL